MNNTFDWRRYLRNLGKMANRTLSALTGGDPEVPNSARWGRLRERHGWARLLCRGLNVLFQQEDHCAGAMKTEDDPGRFASDPSGDHFLQLLAFWLAVVTALIYIHL